MKSFLTIFCCLFLLNCQSKKQNQKTSNNISATIPIKEARTKTVGSKVTVEGTITVASGTYSSSIPFGYAIQDKTGGIYVIDSIPPMEGEFKMGELVRLEGILEKPNNLLVIREITANKVGKGDKIIPIKVKTGEVNGSNEGRIVHTSGIIDSLVDDHPYGYKIYINDGSGIIDVFVNTSTGFLKDTIKWNVSDSLSAIGLSSQFDEIYEVDPRIATDIKVIPRG